jgi:PAS domain S-box-containing protein
LKQTTQEPKTGRGKLAEMLAIQQRLKALISSSFDAIIAIGPDKKVITFNRQAETLLGYSESEMNGDSVINLHEDQAKAKRIYRAIEENGKFDATDIVLLHKNGTKVPVSVSGKLILDENGNKLGQVGFLRDLREVQSLEIRLKALIEASKAVNSTSELKKILEHVLHSALHAIPAADRGSIFFSGSEGVKLYLKISSYDFSNKALDAMIFQKGEGMVGWVFQHQKPVNCPDAQKDPRYKFIEHPEVKTHRSMLCVPITSSRRIGVICLSHATQINAFSQADLDLLIGFAEQAAIAIQNAELITRTRKEAEELEFLRSVSLKINAQIDIEQILTVLVESGNKLLGTKMAVIHWRGRNREKLQTFVAPPELKGLMTHPRMDTGLTAELFREGKPIVIPDTTMDKRVNRLVVNAGIQSLIGYPLKLHDQVAGALFFNSLQPRHFGEHEIHLITLLLPLAAVAIENSHTIERLGHNQQLSNALVEVSSMLAARQEMDEQLGALAQFMRQELKAPMFFIGLYDATSDMIDYKFFWQAGKKVKPFTLNLKEQKETTISSYIVRKQDPIRWFNAEHKKEECQRLGITPQVVGTECSTCIAFPLEVEGNVLGVISIQSPDSNAWDMFEVSAFQTLAHQASIAIRNGQLIKEVNRSLGSLQSTYQASEKIISELEPDKALNRLVVSICQEFGADQACAVLVNEKGIPYHLSSAGFDEPIELTTSIRPQGYSIEVHRSGIPEFMEELQDLAETVHPKMIERGLRAAAALPLTYQEERLGVLWLHYRQPHHFAEDEKGALRLFTNQAAIAYVNARLHQQLKDARDTAAQIAQMTALGDLKKTLNTIVKGIKSILGCDIVTLYTYHEEKDAFDLPPAIAGTIRFPKKIVGVLEKHTAPYKIVVLDDIHVSEDSQHDTILGSPFAVRENVQSGVGVPLKVLDRRVGACFINYCHQKHSFTPEELIIVRMFASQAAVAIRNALLYEEEQKRRIVLRIVDEAGRAVTGSLKLDEIFATLAEKACKVTGEKGRMAKFASIVTVEGDQTCLKAAYPPIEMDNITAARSDKVKFKNKKSGRIGIVGRAVHEKKSQLVMDVNHDPDYRQSNAATICELAVPIIYRDEVLGVINVEHEERGGLDKDDQQDISLLAAHAAVAIQNARMYQALERKNRHQGAVYEASKIINANLKRSEKELLDLLVNLMVTRIVPTGGAKNVLGAILVYDGGKDTLTLVSTCPENVFGLKRVGEARPIKNSPDGKVGITGKALLEKRTQRVNDVSLIPEYLNYHKKTRSELDIPIMDGDKVLGVLSLECEQVNGFDQEAEDALSAFAELASIAIQNTRIYQALERKSRHQQAIYEASKIINLSLERSEKELLDLLADLIVNQIVPAGGEKSVLSAIQIYDEKNDTLTLVSTFPEKAFSDHHSGEVRSLKQPADGKIGITGKTVREKRPQRVGDVSLIPEYIVFNDKTRSELDVPILDGDNILGVLSLESKQSNGFDQEAEDALSAFAELASIAIQNTRRYRDLKEARATVGNITAVAWMGLVSGAWRHSIGNMAITISDLALLAETYLDSGGSQADVRQVFQQMREIVTEIQAIPMLPLSSESAVEPVLICQLVRDRINQFKSKERYAIITYDLVFNIDLTTQVRASPEWLRRILDILVDNSSRAMKESPEKRITITINALNTGVEILFADTGHGIPASIQSTLFTKPVDKKKGEKGSGIGLLLANTVIQTYGGQLDIHSSGPDGTTMSIWLPIYK